jgi:hypothetical protein
MKPGKNNEGYWTGESMLAQLQDRVLPIFRKMFPDNNDIGVFVFDNSTCHGAYARDALRVQNMIMSDGGKNQPKMRNGWYYQRDDKGKVVLENGAKVKVSHQMWHVNKDGKTVVHGVQRVLSTRNILDAQGKLLLV